MRSLRPTKSLLRAVPLLASLSDEELDRILDSSRSSIVEFKANENIIVEDEIGDCMFLMLDGVVDVRIRAVDGRETTIASLKPGDYFGEQALLPASSGKRNASVWSIRPVRLFRIDKEDVLPALQRLKTAAIGIPSEEAQAIEMLRSVRLFRSFTPEQFERHASAFEIKMCAPGEMIIRETDQEADAMYVIVSGIVEVFTVSTAGKIIMLSRLQRGDYFGEMGILPKSDGSRLANVRANGEVKLVRVQKQLFERVLEQDPHLEEALETIGQAQRRQIEKLIRDTPE